MVWVTRALQFVYICDAELLSAEKKRKMYCQMQTCGNDGDAQGNPITITGIRKHARQPEGLAGAGS